MLQNGPISYILSANYIPTVKFLEKTLNHPTWHMIGWKRKREKGKKKKKPSKLNTFKMMMNINKLKRPIEFMKD